MDPEELEQLKEEYYETLAGSESLRGILNQNAGLVLARVGSYPPWPARYSEPGEYAKMSKFRLKKGHVCVYFFGTRNFGWLPKSGILPFSEDVSALKSVKKYNTQLMQQALDEAKLILDGTEGAGVHFYDRIMERRDEPADLPCEICNRVDDHYSNLILCDGLDCRREFHMNCLDPPLVKVPPGDWFCPECVKDPSKLPTSMKQSDAEQDDDTNTANGSALSPGSSAMPPVKKMKKEKQKIREGSVKRRLQSTAEPPSDSSRHSAKKSRSLRSAGDSSAESSPSKSIPEVSPTRDTPSKAVSQPVSSSKKPPTVETLSHGFQPGAGSVDGTEGNSDMESEERCLICGYGGELIVCEFAGCTKVYHQFCLGAYPFPKDDDATWFCPRHACVLSGERESLLDIDGFSGKGKGISPRKPITKNLLWKCTQCPLAVSSDHFPPLPTTSLFSKKLKTFICPNCSHNAPAKVQLGKMLEKLWSTMATNRQGMPFCGPLLSGLTDADGNTNSRRDLDLFKILAKIRRLEYEESSSFADDVRQLVKNALAIIGKRSQPLREAAKTVRLICTEQMQIHKHKIYAIENKVKRSKLESRKQKEQKDTGPWSFKRKWPIRWRQECGVPDDKNYPQMEARTLEEWTAYVTAAPLYASADVLDDELDEPASRHGHEIDDAAATRDGPSSSTGRAKAWPRSTAGAVHPFDIPNGESSHTVPSFPGLTLSEGTDIMVALGDLSRQEHENKRLQFGGAKESDLDDVDGRDFFLSPSASEMQHMFDQQSNLLRRALEAHTALQKSWLLSQHQMLGLGANNGFSVGEGRLAAELRLANKNLRARLRNKDKLVDQLTSDHTALRSQMAALQRELNESKFRVKELERKRAAEDEIGLSEEKSKVATQATAVEDLSGADTGGGGVSSGEDTNAHKNPYSRFGSRSNARKSAK
uniref:PHD-type domain-containing protein n=1 Tax=Globisporangium ultimum (strain ATCC 200006 / CBS 805.95 / DAOM BR144) TaxID=431595 RepID=K3WS00_GLOUD